VAIYIGGMPPIGTGRDGSPGTRIYLSPGLFGFARLAGFDYLQHVRQALAERFDRRGRSVEIRVADVHPSASIRRRAVRLAQLVSDTSGSDRGPIHLLGHSTGGLDLRLVISPSARLGEDVEGRLAWLDRVASVTSMNTPHFGTPLAAVFATPNGQRLLHAVAAITVASLRLGAPPLAASSVLVAALARTRAWAGLESRLIDRVTDALLRALDPESSREVQEWMSRIQDDQGAIFQLTPESMDLYSATVEDRPGLRYQCTVSHAPPSSARDWLAHVRSPWLPVSAALFHLLHLATSERHPRYPCAPADGGEAALRTFSAELLPPEANDGIVPLRSQLWGEPVWLGRADHLDVVGYFGRREGTAGWLASGAHFDRESFETMMDRIVEGMLQGEASRGGSRPPSAGDPPS